MTSPIAYPVPDRIQWHEGMLLSPQHFQVESSRLDALVAWHSLISNPFGWGVRRLSFDLGLLPGGVLRVLELDAMMPDGTSVCFSAANPEHGTLELKLAPFAEAMAADPLNVYLSLPLSRRMRSSASPSRFKSSRGSPVEDEVSEAMPADVPRLVSNLALVADAVPSALHVYFRLATVLNDNEVIKLGDTMPPLLDLPKDSDLWERVSGFVGQLRSKAAFVAKQTAVPSSRAEDRLAYLEQRERLRNLLTGLPAIEAVIRAQVLHPYSLYLSLCALLGPLSMLRPGALPPVPPEYDHADPLPSLNFLLQSAQDVLSEVSQDYREQKFEYHHGAFEITLQPEWIAEGSVGGIPPRLVVGLRGRPEKDMMAWMEGAIVGSQTAYVSLRERRILGAARTAIDFAQELGVRASAGYTLFAIEVSPDLTLPGQPLVVSNSTESASAQRPQEMVLFVKG